MDAQELIELLSDHRKVNERSVEELKKLSLEFPYSQPVQLLYTIRLSQSSEYLFNRQLGKTAILTADRSVLFDMFEREEETAIETTTTGQPGAVTSGEPLPEPPVEEKATPTDISGKSRDSIEDEQRLEDSLSAAAEPEKEKEPLQVPDAEASDNSRSLQDKVQAILEENRRLREKYEGSRQESSAINRRISEIRDKLDQIKEKQESSTNLAAPEPDVSEHQSEEAAPATSEVSQNGPGKREDQSNADIKSSEEMSFSISDKDYDADEEAMLREKEESEDFQLVDDVDESIAAKEQEAAEPVFAIDDEPEERDGNLRSDEEHSFSEWLHHLSPTADTRVSQTGNEEAPDRNPQSAPKSSTGKEEIQEASQERTEVAAKFELLDSFVEKLPELKKKKTHPAVARPTQAESELTEEESSLVTETLARVYIKQKHYDKAIKAYEILRLKYPEKSGFFADRISEIKKLSNS